MCIIKTWRFDLSDTFNFAALLCGLATPYCSVFSLETLKEGEGDSDSESGQMVDGILSSAPKESYELPSQSELIRHAFAGDDVEEEFEKDKQEILNEENPEPDKPVLLPGWGQWTHVQQKKGLPSWMLKEHEDAKRKREESVKNRKDAQLKHVIISEKVDKKVSGVVLFFTILMSRLV